MSADLAKQPYWKPGTTITDALLFTCHDGLLDVVESDDSEVQACTDDWGWPEFEGPSDHPTGVTVEIGGKVYRITVREVGIVPPA